MKFNSSFFFWFWPRGILGRAPTVGGTFKPVPQPQQMRFSYDSNWGANSIKPLKGAPLTIELTLCWWLRRFLYLITHYIRSLVLTRHTSSSNLSELITSNISLMRRIWFRFFFSTSKNWFSELQTWCWI